jgi:hypothetical protein
MLAEAICGAVGVAVGEAEGTVERLLHPRLSVDSPTLLPARPASAYRSLSASHCGDASPQVQYRRLATGLPPTNLPGCCLIAACLPLVCRAWRAPAGIPSAPHHASVSTAGLGCLTSHPRTHTDLPRDRHASATPRPSPFASPALQPGILRTRAIRTRAASLPCWAASLASRSASTAP